MKNVLSMVRRFVSDDKGLETVEYAIIAALITLASIATITAVGLSVSAKFDDLNNKLK